jgi:predicted Zn-dependent peptidase
MRPITALFRAAVLCSFTLAAASAQDSFAEFKGRVTRFTLDNGLKFIVAERHQAPVASFYTYADVGSVQDPKGQTGLAHMFEHLAFKGTPTIGTTNYAEERLSLDRVDQAFIALLAERDKGAGADKAKLAELQKSLEAAQDGAGKFVVTNEFGRVIEQSGGRGLNASTSDDKTDYFFSLPSNQAELWFFLESERWLHPVLREFYKEAAVVREERRMRVESQPTGRLLEDFLHAAYIAHPYGTPTVGYDSDLQSFTRKDAEEFFQKNYGPSNLTCVIVGDVDPKKIRELAETYFGRISARPKGEPTRTIEPPQRIERRLTMQAQAQRIMIMGYHKPSATDADSAVYDAIGSLLSDGRSSRLTRNLVTQKKVAVAAGGFPDFPGEKYPGLFVFFGYPAPGKTNEDFEKEMAGEIERLKTELVSTDELAGVKRRARANLLGGLDSNTGLAQLLAKFEVLTGSWENLFTYLDKAEKVTPADIQRVARSTFVNTNRTVAYMEPAARPAASAQGNQ